MDLFSFWQTLAGLIPKYHQHERNGRSDPHQKERPANRATFFPIKFVGEDERNPGPKRAPGRAY